MTNGQSDEPAEDDQSDGRKLETVNDPVYRSVNVSELSHSMDTKAIRVMT
jgi:hypothetical protein